MARRESAADLAAHLRALADELDARATAPKSPPPENYPGEATLLAKHTAELVALDVRAAPDAEYREHLNVIRAELRAAGAPPDAWEKAFVLALHTKHSGDPSPHTKVGPEYRARIKKYRQPSPP